MGREKCHSWSPACPPAAPAGPTSPRQEPACGVAPADAPRTRPARIKKSVHEVFLRTRGTARLHQIFPAAPALRGVVETKLDALATFQRAPRFFLAPRFDGNGTFLRCFYKRGSAAKSAIREVPPVLARPRGCGGVHIPSPGTRLWGGPCGRALNPSRSNLKSPYVRIFCGPAERRVCTRSFQRRPRCVGFPL